MCEDDVKHGRLRVEVEVVEIAPHGGLRRPALHGQQHLRQRRCYNFAVIAAVWLFAGGTLSTLLGYSSALLMPH